MQERARFAIPFASPPSIGQPKIASNCLQLNHTIFWYVCTQLIVIDRIAEFGLRILSRLEMADESELFALVLVKV